LSAAGFNPAHWRSAPRSEQQRAFAVRCSERGADAVFWDRAENEGFDLPPLCIESDDTLRWATDAEGTAALPGIDDEPTPHAPPMRISRTTEGEGTGIFTPEGVELTDDQAEEWAARIAGADARMPLPG